MSFLQDNIINNTQLYQFPEDDSDETLFIKKYYAGLKSNAGQTSSEHGKFDTSFGDSKADEYNTHKNTIVNTLIDYNYLRYLNSQLSLAILAAIYFNYEVMNMDN